MYIEESIGTCPLLSAQFTKLLSKITESKSWRLLIPKPVWCLWIWSGVNCLHSPFWFSKIHLHIHKCTYVLSCYILWMKWFCYHLWHCMIQKLQNTQLTLKDQWKYFSYIHIYSPTHAHFLNDTIKLQFVKIVKIRHVSVYI